ncbi:nuclear transport factor 2 family protein [Ulvibacterium sp.]|uniref:nuclear transport factor 2 family protein n=1 Tax=Ulvibacterium sp. TaxID=2665914 RepID=UPI003BABC7BF
MIYLVKYIIFFILFLVHTFVGAQLNQKSELFQSLKEKDSILFDAAFNQCDTETMADLFSEDFEFYHDKGGVTFGKGNFLKPMEENCAKRNPNDPQPAKRILLNDSLEVFPLYKEGELYGAIQHGVHRFEFLNENQEYQKGDIAKFTHVWILDEGTWKIKWELSYDHQPTQQQL